MVGESDARPQRLIITEMVLENFKSYAGEQRVGPFHKCFSSVVGPNGSGKSNVIDAMLFVFGKRAKQLRLNKVSELIHNSAGRQGIEHAQVSVHFQEIIDTNDDEFEVVPGTNFVVSRTAHRSNKSDYFIDGRRSNFTEVTELLKGKGIDLDNNRFLILQGEVEQISMMKPKAQTEHETGLLEYLEDIIGTNRFIEPLADSAKRLETLGEARAGLVARLKIAEREREALEADKLAAEAWLDKEREACAAQRLLSHVLAHQAQMNVDKIQGNQASLEGKLAYEREKLGQYSAVLEEHEARYDAACKEHAGMAAALERANEEFKEYERKDIAYREELKHLKAKLAKTAERERRDAARLESTEAEAAAAEAEVPALLEAAAKLGAQLTREEARLEAALEGMAGEGETLRAKLRAARAELAPWEARGVAARAKRAEAASERELVRAMRDGASSALEAARDELEEALGRAAREREAAAELEAGAGGLRDRVSTAQRAVREAEQEAQRAESAARTLRGSVAQRRAERTSASSASAVAQALASAKARGAIPGIYGRLGDLGAVDTRYDVAVSSAAPALDHWVVDSTATAQRCVELLRSRGLGRMRPAFFFALRDTLVAADLDQAARIAYGPDPRWRRVVTLAGEDAAAELAGAEKELGEAEGVSSRAAEALSRAEAELTAARAALASSESALPRARLDAEAAAARARDLRAALPGLERAVAERSGDEAALRRLDAARELEGLGGEPVRRLRGALAALQAEIEGKEGAAAKRTAAGAAARKLAAKLRPELERVRGEAEALRAKQEATKNEFKALDEAALEVLKGRNAAEAALAERAADLADLRAGFEAKNREVGVIRRVEQDILAEMEWGEAPAAPTPEELAAASTEDLQYRTTLLREEMERMSIDLTAIEAWRAKDAEYGVRAAELESATAQRDEVRRAHEDLRKQRLDGFMAGFNAVSLKLKEMYQMITLGGDAELELVDSLDPFSEGILFSVRPPKKSWKNIANLSGGEKTLSSLSLVFALHHYKPTPLYVMDEIDAALDFKNVSIVGHYIKERTKNAQFVIISLRNNMFELADRLVGIYKTDNATKSVAIDPGAFVVGATGPAPAVARPVLAA
ncbi:Structural maintenance of chromosomes protein 4 [Auxenochlorella protothecoides]|uniref:Structural maintenance of chromosomes protein 4 n=1 Tax=Auxenochlorella protothecoides TaxID=3075 RepID=A0A087SLB6_AUXPR|nr:Structural maintenance of chromosomes protein 4 [Auxenochlorella protothecoides]KFM26520.1 Structural maintenance of chromosomes protein 4 [Auxenochlorella protothecoides]